MRDMHYPYWRYILFLHTLGYTSQRIMSKLYEVRYPVPLKKWIIALCKSYAEKFAPIKNMFGSQSIPNKDSKHRFLNVMIDVGIQEMWYLYIEHYPSNHYSIVGEELLLIFHDNEYRSLAEGLLLKGLGAEEILTAYEARFGLKLQTDTLAAFQRIFWDISVMSNRDWHAYIDQCDNESKKKYINAAIYSSKEYLLWLNKITPDLKWEQILGNLRDTIYHRLNEMDITDIKGFEMSRWVTSLCNVGDRHHILKSGHDKDFHEQLELNIKKKDYTYPQFDLKDEDHNDGGDTK